METLSQPLTNVMIAQDTGFHFSQITNTPASLTALACVLMWPHGSGTAQTPGGAGFAQKPACLLLPDNSFPADPASLSTEALRWGRNLSWKPRMKQPRKSPHHPFLTSQFSPSGVWREWSWEQNGEGYESARTASSPDRRRLIRSPLLCPARIPHQDLSQREAHPQRTAVIGAGVVRYPKDDLRGDGGNSRILALASSHDTRSHSLSPHTSATR